jgi:GTP1/Obg family GTP-binding protein
VEILKVIDIAPRDIYFLIEFSLTELQKLKKVSALLTAKPEQSEEETEALDFLDKFFDEVTEILKETGDVTKSISKRSKL